MMEQEEQDEWIEAIDDVLKQHGSDQAIKLIKKLATYLTLPSLGFLETDFCNTIPSEQQSPYPGSIDNENRLEALIRWNAIAMVARAQWHDYDLGGHIGTFASIATLYDVGFHHFWKGGEYPDLVYYQGHSTPGIYARSFLEYRIDEERLEYFRREVDGKGLSSYPHPWLMPNYWQFPTVSMGLGPLQAIYQARFMRYLEARKLIPQSNRKVWCFCGDAEMDEPESQGALSIAGREHLSNLIFVINCNLQGLDGPVRPAGKIINELEKVFIGYGWKVIKVLWNSAWDTIFDQDVDGAVRQRLASLHDADLQAYHRFGWRYFKENFFKGTSTLEKLRDQFPDDIYQALAPGGHDREKIYAAYQEALATKDSPVVILAHSIKGYGLGAIGEAVNTAHNTKKLPQESLLTLKERFNLPLSEEDILELRFYRPAQDDPLIQYMIGQRQKLQGVIPERREPTQTLPAVDAQVFRLFDEGSQGKKFSTTMAYVRVLSALLRVPAIKEKIVLIVPDVARTFGMEGLFKQIGIYNPDGGKDRAVDEGDLMPYRTDPAGQLLQEGINEAGAFCSWLSAATAYSIYNCPLIPFYTFYSIFGFQRIGDLTWLAGDSHARGFLIGATSGRTTLHGEGLQHQDGHTHLLASTNPAVRCYDPAFSYEVAYLIKHGLQQFALNVDEFFYITVMNEFYEHPPKPVDADEGIVKGMYLLQQVGTEPCCDLLGSGAILNEVIAAAEILLKDYHIATRVWSVTSFTELRRQALECDHRNLHTLEKNSIPYVTTCLGDGKNPVIAATDYMKLQADQVRAWIKRPYSVLGTDGFGRSDRREKLREHFEVSRFYIAYTTLYELVSANLIDCDLKEVQRNLGIDPLKEHPLTA